VAGLVVRELGAPIDVLWMRISQHPGDPAQSLGRIDRGRILIMLDRGDYWQCAYVIRKGAFAEIQGRGMDAFRADFAEIVPFVADRLGEIRDWPDIKLLTVKVDRLQQWHRPGLLCLGDAAHAMSPIGGVGINLAIQDAVAAANILTAPLRRGRPPEQALHAVQRRRELPTRITQRGQMLIQNRIIDSILGSQSAVSPPWPVRVLGRWPFLQRIPARLIGVGIRPEHVRTAAMPAASASVIGGS
jgi:2-polyprenyl-6-methoxyphenol hydroxylase-like FAD-dependent oxidoreductase